MIYVDFLQQPNRDHLRIIDIATQQSVGAVVVQKNSKLVRVDVYNNKNNSRGQTTAAASQYTSFVGYNSQQNPQSTSTETIFRSRLATRGVSYSCQQFGEIQNQNARGVLFSRRRKSSIPVNMTETLDWETFDYSDRPKHDIRFSNREILQTSNLEDLVINEAEADKVHANEINSQHSSHFQTMDPEFLAAATSVVEPYINPKRLSEISTVLAQRTKQSCFLFENPTNPSNVWACLRSLDSFGIQNVHVVVDSSQYNGKAMLNAKRGMRSAMGSASWLTIQNHPSTLEAITKLKEEGYTIYASDLTPDSVDIRDLKWDSDDGRQNVCVVIGNEMKGISDEMRGLVDVTFTIPMLGMAESFNLSASTAITLAHMSANSD